MRTMHHRAIILMTATLFACVALLGGCSNSSTGPGLPEDYPEATSPQEVLQNFTRAYVWRDIDEFLACLSSDFKFYFTEDDQQQWPQLPPWFYKSDEQQVHENMFGDDWGVESITLNLVPVSVETIPGENTSRLNGDVVVMLVDADFRVNKAGGITYLACTPQEFRFREVAGSRDRDETPLWEMFEWHDKEDRGTGSGREEAGWGGIKFTFLESLSEQPHRTSPADVIDQLEAAYIARDLESYMDCLSDSFIFYPTEEDVQDPSNDIPAEWYRSTERTIHENMFGGSSNVESITLTLTNDEIFWDEQDPSDPLDDIYSHTEDVDLRVNIVEGVTYLATEPSMYLLRVDPDEVGPYDELMWEIFEWHELSNWKRGNESERAEDTSWGGIKALYR